MVQIGWVISAEIYVVLAIRVYNIFVSWELHLKDRLVAIMFTRISHDENTFGTLKVHETPGVVNIEIEKMDFFVLIFILSFSFEIWTPFVVVRTRGGVWRGEQCGSSRISSSAPPPPSGSSSLQQSES